MKRKLDQCALLLLSPLYPSCSKLLVVDVAIDVDVDVDVTDDVVVNANVDVNVDVDEVVDVAECSSCC